MAQFPDNIYTPRETENLPGIVYDPTNKQNMYSEDFQNLGGEIEAIETALGENLKNVELSSVGESFVQAYRASSVQSIASNITTKAQLNAESWDLNSEFDKYTNYCFTCNFAGYY